MGITATGNFSPAFTQLSVGFSSVGVRNQDSTIRLSGTTPAVPATIPNIMELRVGGAHACVRKSDGTVWCWGANGNGQLGNGTFNNSLTTAVQVTGISGARSIAAGDQTSCATTATTTYCWGLGMFGALGNGAGATSNVPVVVSGLGASQKVSTSAMHTCAINRVGEVWCWGTGNAGQLGNGLATNTNVPVQAQGINGAVSVAVGGIHSCAVETSGRIFCWGGNDWGQLGFGDTTPSSIPLMALTPIENPVAEVATGSFHTCARALDGTVYCWGAGALGQVGDGWGIGQLAPATVLGGAKQIGAGSNTSCALMKDITIQCWGDNSQAQLDSTKFNRFVPAPVSF